MTLLLNVSEYFAEFYFTSKTNFEIFEMLKNVYTFFFLFHFWWNSEQNRFKNILRKISFC